MITTFKIQLPMRYQKAKDGNVGVGGVTVVSGRRWVLALYCCLETYTVGVCFQSLEKNFRGPRSLS
jgi:hypothetical protein